MMTLACNRVRLGPNLFSIVLTVLTLIPLWTAQAQNKGAKPENTAARIFIQADKLIAYNETRMFELIGNVKAVRGTMVIQADRLKVYPHEASQSQDYLSSFANKVNKVLATGNVHITYGKFNAVADQAVYTAQKETIELIGKPTKVTQGDQSMTANRMTLFIEDERVRVTGQGKQRVKAIFNR